MSQRIIIKITADGSTEVRTEGFAGNACRQASECFEKALGIRQTEQLTKEFFETTTVENPSHLQQGE